MVRHHSHSIYCIPPAPPVNKCFRSGEMPNCSEREIWTSRFICLSPMLYNDSNTSGWLHIHQPLWPNALFVFIASSLWLHRVVESLYLRPTWWCDGVSLGRCCCLLCGGDTPARSISGRAGRRQRHTLCTLWTDWRGCTGKRWLVGMNTGQWKVFLSFCLSFSAP